MQLEREVEDKKHKLESEILDFWNDFKVFTDDIDDTSLEQLRLIRNLVPFRDSKIRIMPDVHAGKGCVVGFTAKTKKHLVIPSIIGVDIGCSVSTYKVKFPNWKEKLPQLDSVIKQYVPSGKNMHEEAQDQYIPEDFAWQLLGLCHMIGDAHSYHNHMKALGTLGGGNHFIELGVPDNDPGNDRDSEYVYLTIHTGSRNLGYKIGRYFQEIAKQQQESHYKDVVKYTISKTVPTEREKALLDLKEYYATYVTPFPALRARESIDFYIECVKFAQEYAKLNHHIIFKIISEHMGWEKEEDYIFTQHNYIEERPLRYIIRKGAVSAKEGEKILIPLNMCDGVLVCRGKGNEDWNNSAPHGAGRKFSRKQARATITRSEYEESMKNVYSTTVNDATIDEAPAAYKDTVVEKIKDTVDILYKIVPVYNFKDASEGK